MRYGVWWHDFAEQIPWVRAGLAFNSNNESELVDVWERIFQVSVASSPDPARSKREWQLLQEQIKSSTEFGQRLRDCDLIRYEMPFFWKINGPGPTGNPSRIGSTKSLEGIVDLAFFDPVEKKWFILDWKTNRITADEIEMLRVRYRPQIAAYWKAVTEITSAPVEAAIYSTSAGHFISYNRDELATEWERLRGLRFQNLAVEIAAN
jgi:ATP-dependent exoDNAse (exonuclease V) beta subunit